MVTTKSRELSIYDARTGEKQCSTQLIHDGTMPSRVLFYGKPEPNNSERLITTGSSRSTRRQIALYSSRPLDAPLAVVDIDGGSGFLMPLVDNDLNLLYIAGKVHINFDFLLTINCFSCNILLKFLIYKPEYSVVLIF